VSARSAITDGALRVVCFARLYVTLIRLGASKSAWGSHPSRRELRTGRLPLAVSRCLEVPCCPCALCTALTSSESRGTQADSPELRKLSGFSACQCDRALRGFAVSHLKGPLWVLHCSLVVISRPAEPQALGRELELESRIPGAQDSDTNFKAPSCSSASFLKLRPDLTLIMITLHWHSESVALALWPITRPNSRGHARPRLLGRVLRRPGGGLTASSWLQTKC
jgi:hypothetical protein